VAEGVREVSGGEAEDGAGVLAAVVFGVDARRRRVE
jgi:hypothetical protein